MEDLLKKCEAVLLKENGDMKFTSRHLPNNMKLLLLADQYGLTELRDHCVDNIVRVTPRLSMIEDVEQFAELSDATKVVLFRTLIVRHEDRYSATVQSAGHPKSIKVHN